jgi:peptide/nickel transport system ATP-binding protein
MLEVSNLSVRIGPHEIVSIDEFSIPSGRSLGLVGESGSGKTMTAMSIVGLQPRGARITGSIRFEGRELVGLDARGFARLRGSEVGVVFQDPLKALNPTMRVGRQVAEGLRLKTSATRAEARARTLTLLEQVRLSDVEGIAHRYPHQLSGGQRQRVLIAIAVSCSPKLLIADEPTTALDVTVQQGILDLLRNLSEERDMGLLFVSHDLGVVRNVCDHVAVLYAGRLMETGPISTVIERPSHRYSEALIRANPGKARGSADIGRQLGTPLGTIKGAVPPLGAFPEGCRFRGRCLHEVEQCVQTPPITRLSDDHRFVCWNPASGD